MAFDVTDDPEFPERAAFEVARELFPLLHPYGHVVFQAQRGDVDTVIVNGRVVLVCIDLQRARDAVERTVEYAIGQVGEEAWTAGMNPEIPETKVLENPYTYTDRDAGSAQWKQ
jgi:hypothetical protein